MERSDTNQRISVRCLHPHPCIVDPTQKTKLEEMPGVGPGSAENLVELLLLLSLCSIHPAMHGATVLVSIVGGSLGRSSRRLPLSLSLQFIFTNELLERCRVKSGTSPRGEPPSGGDASAAVRGLFFGIGFVLGSETLLGTSR